MDKKLNIAVIGGGNSSEHEISMRGVEQVAGWVDPQRYNVYTVLVKGNDWTLRRPELGDVPVSKDDFSATVGGDKLRFDCALIVIHGTPGENGLLQGYFEMLGIPHTTCNTMSSAITFNKYICKELVKATGVKMARGVLLRKGQQVDADGIVRSLRLPLFVKPNASGSSYGVTKVKTVEQLQPAIDLALTEGDSVLIEEFIAGREFSGGVFKWAKGEVLMPITEIISQTEFFDYEAKYMNKSQEVTPAQIPDTLAHAMQRLSSAIYDRLFCSGIVRIDYIVHDNEPYFLEINTVPGMSAQSIIPQQVKAMGGNMRDMFNMVIEDAMSRR